MIEITCNDRLGKKVRVKCNPDDTILDLKKLIALQIGTHYHKIILKKWYRIFNDNVTLADCKYRDSQNDFIVGNSNDINAFSNFSFL